MQPTRRAIPSLLATRPTRRAMPLYLPRKIGSSHLPGSQITITPQCALFLNSVDLTLRENGKWRILTLYSVTFLMSVGPSVQP
jgi:hypothetical protein